VTSRPHVLVAGAGYVGAPAAAMLAARGCQVTAVRRSSVPDQGGVRSIALDLLRGDLDELPTDVDAVAWAISPTPDEVGYRSAYVDGPRRLLDHLRERGAPLRRTVLVSSTSVWHRTDGAEVDEDTPPSPADFRGRAVLEGEAVLRDSAHHAVALRFSGIYGPGRTRLVERIIAGQAAPPAKENHGNRIWRDDGAKAIVHALTIEDPAPVYVVSDDDPADLREVYSWLAERLGVTLPPPAQSHRGRGGNKRCRNHLLRRSGFRLDIPDYRAGYSLLLNQR
jgi:nucleoside-diphosphate-sugar epimerase